MQTSASKHVMKPRPDTFFILGSEENGLLADMCLEPSPQSPPMQRTPSRPRKPVTFTTSKKRAGQKPDRKPSREIDRAIYWFSRTKIKIRKGLAAIGHRDRSAGENIKKKGWKRETGRENRADWAIGRN
jgi:tmRNA-binding protein